MTKPKKYLIYADGACTHNGRTNAKACGSFAVYDVTHLGFDDDVHDVLVFEQPLHHESMFDVIATGRATNNMAEAQALHTALAWACQCGLLSPGNEVHVCMDSQLVLNQFTGMYKTKNVNLRSVYTRTYDMLRKQSEKVGCDVEGLIHFHWISGEVMKASVIAH